MNETFSKEEKAAMKAAVAEAKAAKAGADLKAACLAAIDAMDGKDKELAEILHTIVESNTDLQPKTWYGMPAYANKDGKVIVFFQSAGKFKVRYATIGFQPDANLDEGNLWATSFAVTDLNSEDQKRIKQLILQAIS